ncbi:MAG: 3-oxoacyl-ACP reductase [Hyphomicrobiales bacterium]|nr:MAG: 3-oxoacyl-ACP reductase [Hyphomicrobiales bacterium]
MDLGLKGKKAIICASSEGLGRASAFALAQAGCDVIINGRTQVNVEGTAKEIADATGVTATPVVADVSTAEGQAALLAACPSPDILINNNGGPPKRDFSELNRENMIEGVIQNLITPVELIQKVAEGMMSREFGRIVNITSMSVLMPIEGLDLSSGARAGLTALLAGVRPLYAGQNVTINNLLPGKFNTKRLMGGIEAAAQTTGRPLQDIVDSQTQQIPAGRFGSPEEFGNTCAFLCSQHAGYITGQNILMDGGLFPHSF